MPSHIDSTSPPSIKLKNPIDELNVDEDPLARAFHYAREEWFQQMVPARTRCFRCANDSPIVFVPHGSLAFGDQKGVRRGERDVSKQVIMAFADVGWKFQKHKAYCPACKGLGGI